VAAVCNLGHSPAHFVALILVVVVVPRCLWLLAMVLLLLLLLPLLTHIALAADVVAAPELLLSCFNFA